MLKTYKRKERISVRKFEGEYYLIGGKKNYKINEIGMIILKYIGSDLDILELRVKILKVYGGAIPEKVDRDITDFIEFLLAEDIIEKA